MLNAKRVARGQIWHWSDPIYGEHSADEQNIVGENTIRYSRYVLVVQDEPRDDSVMVIPLSTKSNKITDYRIPVWSQKFGETFSFLRIDRVFNVHPSQLDGYVCVVSDEVLKLVEAELLRLLCPSIYKDSQFSAMLLNKGLPMDQVSEDHWVDEENSNRNQFTVIGKFIKQMVKSVPGESTASDSIYQVYTKWCIDNNYIPPEKRSTFFDLFCILLHLTKDTTGAYTAVFKNIHVEGPETLPAVVTKPESKVETAPPCSKTKSSSSTKKRWDEEAREKFMKYLDNHTVAETAKKFGIATNSVYKYRKQFSNIVLVDADMITDPSDTSKNANQIMKEVRESISYLSNFIKDDLKANDAYSYTAKDETFRSSEYMDKKEFYKKISASLYYSLMVFMEIKENSTKAFYHPNPETLYDSEAYISVSNIVSWARAGETPYEIRKRIKNKEGGINQNWINFLNEQLSNRLNLTPENIASISQMVLGTYCK